VCKSDQVATVHGYVSAERVVDAVEEPLEIEEAKSHLNFASAEHERDGDVLRWIKTARHKLERDTGLALRGPQTWQVTVEQFPSFRQSLYLPVWPVVSIESFVYVDRDGAEQDLLTSPSNFILASKGRPAQLGLIDTATWPTDARQFHPGTLTLTAGWAAIADIPTDLVMALLKLTGDFAGFRESMLLGQMSDAPMRYDDLIAPWVLPVVA
jgi:uncharacterized phiE125 gp8 family phage protein